VGAGQVLPNPWTLVPTVFSPGYVGGWSAAEHWDLTEQLFRKVCVISASSVRHKEVELQGVVFRIKRISEDAIFGTRPVWEGRIKIPVSDVHRTIVDMLTDPALGGGIQHVTACLEAYIGSAAADVGTVLAYAERLGTGAVFKRLGFLLSRLGFNDPEVLHRCEAGLTRGYAKLDPHRPCPRLVTRWRVWVPEGWERQRDD